VEEVTAKAHWEKGRYQFEWRVDVGKASSAQVQLSWGMILRVDVALWDLDEDESASWMVWSKGDNNSKIGGDLPGSNYGALGFVSLGEETAFGKIKGKIKWEDMEEGTRLGRVRIQSMESEDLWGEVKTDSQGAYEADLPVGRYRVAAGYRRAKTDTLPIDVETGEIHVPVLYFSPPPVGVRIRAGAGTAGVSGAAHTQPAGSGSRRENFRTYNLSDGLPSSFVLSLLCDRTGALWIGTEGGGVSRYDGVEFSTLTAENGLPGNDVWAIAEDNDGALWFATGREGAQEGRGICRYDNISLTRFDTTDGLVSDRVLAMDVDTTGTVWFGTERGVSRYDGKTFINYTVEDGLPDMWVATVLVDNKGDVWFGTGSGFVSRYDGDRFTNYRPLSGHITSALQAANGDLWFGTWYNGVSRYDGEGFTTYDEDDGIRGAKAIVQDRAGLLWFGHDGQGVYRFDGSEFLRIDVSDGLPIGVVYSLVHDNEGQMWCGTTAGLSRYYGEQLTVFTGVDFPGAIWTWEIAEDSTGSLWFATSHGATRYENGSFTTFTTDDGLLNDNVGAVFVDREGNVWLGTEGGVSRYDGSTFKGFTTVDGLARNAVTNIAQDLSDQIWIASESGITCYDGAHFDAITNVAVPLSNVNDILVDRKGGVWFTSGSGLNSLVLYDGIRFTNYYPTGRRKDGRSLAQDVNGNLWIGTWGAGVARYFDGEFAYFDSEDGVTGNWEHSVVADRDGRMWIGTFGGGVTIYDGTVFQNLMVRDGLPSNNVRVLYQDHTGDIWMGTEGGLVRYRPSRHTFDAVVTDVMTNRRLGPVLEVSMPATQDFLSIEYRVKSLSAIPGRILYQYRMKGYVEEWQQTRESRVEYTDLPLGGYEFQVRAIDQDLNYSELGKVRVVVHPPYGQIALSGGLALALIGFVMGGHYGFKHRRERNQAREQLVQELEEELQTAHDMQMGLMPSESPKIQGLDITGRCIPANHVGGDFFQYFPISDNLLAVSLADVTGHAMEAAVPVMMFSGVLESEIKHGQSLVDLFASLNQTLHKTLDKRTFVCFTMGELDTATKKFRLSNGGCPYPYHYKAISGDITELQVDAYPLGVRAETTYPVIETQLERGDRIVFCSDGIIEAEDSSGELFGFERTADTIKKGCEENLTAPKLLDYLINEVKSFSEDTPQGDDQTIIVLQVES